MGKYTNNYDCDCDYTLVSGNSLDMDINYCESEIRADIVVHEYKSLRLWGRIINCDGEPVANALIKLLKVVYQGGYYTYKGIAHTVSDCDGFYQFELTSCDDDDEETCYKILVSKACYGPERMVPINNSNCDPCDDQMNQPCNNNYDSCDCYNDYDHIVIRNKNDKCYANPNPGCKCGENNPPKNPNC